MSVSGVTKEDEIKKLLFQHLKKQNTSKEQSFKVHLKELVKKKPRTKKPTLYNTKIAPYLNRYINYFLYFGFFVFVAIVGLVYFGFYYAVLAEPMVDSNSEEYLGYVIYISACFLILMIVLVIVAYLERELGYNKKNKIEDMKYFQTTLGLLYFFFLVLVFSFFGIFVHVLKGKEGQNGILCWQAGVTIFTLFALRFFYSNFRIAFVKKYKGDFKVVSLYSSLAFFIFFVINCCYFFMETPGVGSPPFEDVSYFSFVVLSIYLLGALSFLIDFSFVLFCVIVIFVQMLFFFLSIAGTVPETYYAFIFFSICLSFAILLVDNTKSNMIMANILSIMLFFYYLAYSITMSFDVDCEDVDVYYLLLSLLFFVPAFLKYNALFLPITLTACVMITKLSIFLWMVFILFPIILIIIIFFDKKEFVDILADTVEKEELTEKETERKSKYKNHVYNFLKSYIFITCIVGAIGIIVRTNLEITNSDILIPSIIANILLGLNAVVFEFWNHDLFFPIRYRPLLRLFRSKLQKGTDGYELESFATWPEGVGEEEKKKLLQNINPLHGTYWFGLCLIAIIVSCSGIEKVGPIFFTEDDYKFSGYHFTYSRMVLIIICVVALLVINITFNGFLIHLYYKNKKSDASEETELVVKDEKEKEEGEEKEEPKEGEEKEEVTRLKSEVKIPTLNELGDKKFINSIFVKYSVVQFTLFGIIVYLLFPLLLTNKEESYQFIFLFIGFSFFLIYIFGWKMDNYFNYAHYFKESRLFGLLDKIENVKILRPMAVAPCLGLYIIYITKEILTSFSTSDEFPILHLFLVIIVVLEILFCDSRHKLMNFVIGFFLLFPIFITEIIKFYVQQLDYLDNPMSQIFLDLELTLFLVLGLDHTFFKISKKKPYIQMRNRLLDNDIIFITLIFTISILSALFTTHYYIFFVFSMLSNFFFIVLPSKTSNPNRTLLIKKIVISILPLFWIIRLLIDVLIVYSKIGEESESFIGYEPVFYIYLSLLFAGVIIWVVLMNLPFVKKVFVISNQSKFKFKQMLIKTNHNARFNFVLYILNEIYVIAVIFSLTYLIKGYAGLIFELIWLGVIVFVPFAGDFFYLLILPIQIPVQFYFLSTLNQTVWYPTVEESIYISMIVGTCMTLVIFIIGRLTDMFRYSVKYGTFLHRMLFEYYWFICLLYPVFISFFQPDWDGYPMLIFFVISIVRAFLNGTQSYHYAVCLTYGTLFLIFSYAANIFNKSSPGFYIFTGVLIILSILVLTFLQISDHTKLKSKSRTIVDKIFIFVCSLYLIIVPVLFSVFQPTLFWLFEVLYVFYSFWFCIIFASYGLLYIIPLSSAIFVYLLYTQDIVSYPTYMAEGREELLYVCLGFVGAWIHVLIFFILSKSGVLYLFKSLKSRKLLFYPVWYFQKRYLGKYEGKFYKALERISPDLVYDCLGKMFKKASAVSHEISNELNSKNKDVDLPEPDPEPEIAEKELAEEERRKRAELIKKKLLDWNILSKEEVSFAELRECITSKNYFGNLWKVLKDNVKVSFVDNYQKTLSTLFLLEMLVLTFGTISFGTLPLITFIVLIIYLVSYKLIMPSLIFPILIGLSIMLNFLYWCLLVDVKELTGYGNEYWLMIPAGLGMLVPSLIFYFVFCGFKRFFVNPYKDEDKVVEKTKEEIEAEKQKKIEEDAAVIEENLKKFEKTEIKGSFIVKAFNPQFQKEKYRIIFNYVKSIIMFFLKSEFQDESKLFHVTRALFFIINNSYVSFGVYLIFAPMTIEMGGLDFKYSTLSFLIPSIIMGIIELFLSVFYRHNPIRRVIAVGRVSLGVYSCFYVIPWTNFGVGGDWIAYLLITVSIIIGSLILCGGLIYSVFIICVRNNAKLKEQYEEKKNEFEQDVKKYIPPEIQKLIDSGNFTTEQIEAILEQVLNETVSETPGKEDAEVKKEEEAAVPIEEK